MVATGVQEDKNHLVIIVPGIRDRGNEWNVVRTELESAGFSATIAGWSEYFGVPRFLVPAAWFRRIAMHTLEQKIQNAIKTYTVDRKQPRISFIAHSFGSYILCYLLRRAHHLKVYRLILCGSVLPRSFKFASFEERFESPVINDIGLLDLWPFVASCVTFGYGTIGTYGYVGEPVIDRFHKDVGHGDFAKKGFCNKWWVPVLRQCERKDIRLPRPNMRDPENFIAKSFYRILQNLKWFVLLAILILLLVFAPRWVPCSIQSALRMRLVPCDVGVHIERVSDMTGTKCENGKRVYKIVNQDTLTFTQPISIYDAQGYKHESSDLEITYSTSRGPEHPRTLPIFEHWLLDVVEGIPVNGTNLTIKYSYKGVTTNEDDEWGLAFVSSLPILSIKASVKLPEGVRVTSLNEAKEYDNRAFAGCNIPTGERPILFCNSPLNNKVNIPQSLYWKWTAFEGC